VLFNLAALYSQMADGASRVTADGLKTAASHLAAAAGVLAHMKTEILPNLRMLDPPDDMDEHTLEALSKLCLARCQECFWQRAVVASYKDVIISRLAARVSDLYAEARDAAMLSNAISGPWIHVMGAKHHHFAAAAQYRAALDCLDKKRFGEEIARLRDALKCASDGLLEVKGMGGAIATDLTNLKRQIEDDLKRGERDNDTIYYSGWPCRVPPWTRIMVSALVSLGSHTNHHPSP
jgi:programmed cell death 6-interacting protein